MKKKVNILCRSNLPGAEQYSVWGVDEEQFRFRFRNTDVYIAPPGNYPIDAPSYVIYPVSSQYASFCSHVNLQEKEFHVMAYETSVIRYYSLIDGGLKLTPISLMDRNAAFKLHR